jgi:hypothetical protein
VPADAHQRRTVAEKRQRQNVIALDGRQPLADRDPPPILAESGDLVTRKLDHIGQPVVIGLFADENADSLEIVEVDWLTHFPPP